MERVGADAHVEVVLPGKLGHVLVRRHAGGFESLRGQLLLLVRDLRPKGEGQSQFQNWVTSYINFSLLLLLIWNTPLGQCSLFCCMELRKISGKGSAAASSQIPVAEAGKERIGKQIQTG